MAYAGALLEAALVRVGPDALLADRNAHMVEPVAQIAQRARDAQPVVLPRAMLLPDESVGGDPAPGGLCSALACSLLAVDPETRRPGNGAVVAFDGRMSGRRMIERLVDFPPLRGKRVRVVMASPSTIVTRLELAWAVDRIRTACSVETVELLPGRSADAIPAFVQRHEANLLVLGRHHHATGLHAQIGRTMYELLRLRGAATLVVR